MSVGNVLRLRGLPFTANSEDVVQFFAGIDVQAVYLGSKSGEGGWGGVGKETIETILAACRAILLARTQLRGPGSASNSCTALATRQDRTLPAAAHTADRSPAPLPAACRQEHRRGICGDAEP